jgi:hypothetical protein
MIPSFPTCRKTLPEEPEILHFTGIQWTVYPHEDPNSLSVLTPLMIYHTTSG